MIEETLKAKRDCGSFPFAADFKAKGCIKSTVVYFPPKIVPLENLVGLWNYLKRREEIAL